MDYFLQGDEVLVFEKSQQKMTYVDGYTKIAKVSNFRIEREYYICDVVFLVNEMGDRIESIKMLTTTNNIVSNKYPVELKKYFFQISEELTSGNFVNKNNKQNPITSVSRANLGSGIIGKYFTDEENIKVFKNSFKIEMENPYMIQDLEHSNSLTICSTETNNFLEQKITNFQKSKQIIKKNFIFENLTSSELESLFNLWNICFYRTKDFISMDELQNIFTIYIYDFLIQGNLKNINFKNIIELPINYVLKYMGYDGVIGNDIKTNAWESGCVSFNFENIKMKEIGKVIY
jgi:hypothetical protein